MIFLLVSQLSSVCWTLIKCPKSSKFVFSLACNLWNKHKHLQTWNFWFFIKLEFSKFWSVIKWQFHRKLTYVKIIYFNYSSMVARWTVKLFLWINHTADEKRNISITTRSSFATARHPTAVWYYKIKRPIYLYKLWLRKGSTKCKC